VRPIERTEEQVERWKRDATQKAIDFRLLCHTFPKPSESLFHIPTEGTFTGACRNCEAQEWCGQDSRPLKQLDKMFTKTHWNPRAHAFGKDAWKPDPRVYTIDNSTLKAAYTCSTQAVLRYGWDYANAESMGPLHAGTIVHSAMESFFKTGRATEAMRAFDHAVQELG